MSNDQTAPATAAPPNPPQADEKAVKDSKQQGGKDRDGAKQNSDERNWNDRRREDRKRDNGRGFRRSGNRRNQSNRSNYNNRARKEKEYAKLPITDDPVEIRRQVDFYFSDANLSNDDFLFKKLVKGSANLPVRVKTIHDFGKMRRFQPYSKVVEALRESDTVDLITNKGLGDEEIVRKVPIKVPSREWDDEKPPHVDTQFARCKRQHQIESLDRSVYVRFDSSVEHVEQTDLEDLFRSYGSIMVKRRERDNKWRGSVFVEFGTEEDQKQFLKLETKPEYQGKELKVMSKREYCLQKCAEKKTKPFWEETDERGEPSFEQQNDFEANKKRLGPWAKDSGTDGKQAPAESTDSNVQAEQPAQNGNKRKADTEIDDSERISSPKKPKKGVELLKDE